MKAQRSVIMNERGQRGAIVRCNHTVLSPVHAVFVLDFVSELFELLGRVLRAAENFAMIRNFHVQLEKTQHRGGSVR